jgi:hypothetical protein
VTPEGHKRVIADTYHSLSRVSLKAAERVELLEENVPDPRLLLKLASRSLFEGFIESHESTGQGPFPLERLEVSLDQQQFQLAFVEAEHDTIDCQSGTRMRIGVRHS